MMSSRGVFQRFRDASLFLLLALSHLEKHFSSNAWSIEWNVVLFWMLAQTIYRRNTPMFGATPNSLPKHLLLILIASDSLTILTKNFFRKNFIGVMHLFGHFNNQDGSSWKKHIKFAAITLCILTLIPFYVTLATTYLVLFSVLSALLMWINLLLHLLDWLFCSTPKNTETLKQPECVGDQK